MPELQSEINDLLGELEGSNQENENETEGNEKPVEPIESGENRGENESSAAETENEETGSEQGQQETDSEESGETEEQVASETETEEDSRDAQIKKLQEEINRLSNPQQSQENQQNEETGEAESKPAEEFDPFMGYEFDSIVEDQSTFSDWASKMFQKAKSQAKEEVLTSLPETVNGYINQQLQVRESVNDFYRNNPELSENKNYVSRLANEVAGEHPDWEFPQVLEETARKARETLGLKQQAKAQEAAEQEDSGQKKSPGLAKGTKRSPNSNKGKSAAKADNRSATEKQIDELLTME